MDSGVHLEAICTRIAGLKRIAIELQTLGADIPCLARNTTRILASLKMLEIGFMDVMDLGSGD
jgi:hypothetical protein